MPPLYPQTRRRYQTDANIFCRPVVLHSDHCAEKLLPWFDGMLDADEAYFKEHGEPLFSSHMLDLSEEPKEKNIATCAKYFERMSKIGIWLEMEIGITGGEEDGVDNTGVDNASLYTQPEDILEVFEGLRKIGPNFSIAAAFGNVHGVYKPGNVKLQPELLKKHQAHVSQKLDNKDPKPLYVLTPHKEAPILRWNIQIPRLPRWIRFDQGRDQGCSLVWCCQDERRHW